MRQISTAAQSDCDDRSLCVHSSAGAWMSVRGPRIFPCCDAKLTNPTTTSSRSRCGRLGAARSQLTYQSKDHARRVCSQSTARHRVIRTRRATTCVSHRIRAVSVCLHVCGIAVARIETCRRPRHVARSIRAPVSLQRERGPIVRFGPPRVLQHHELRSAERRSWRLPLLEDAAVKTCHQLRC